jgi:hypothetical protein
MPATHRGTCGACQRMFKVLPGTTILAKHGFQRPHHLHQEIGRCFGAERTAHEVSPVVAQAYLKMLENGLRMARERLADLEAGRVTKLEVRGVISRELRTVEPSDAEWPRALERERWDAERKVKHLALYVGLHEKLVAAWAQRELVPIGVMG